MKSVIETLQTLVSLLDQLSIEYAIMGGFAVRAHGVRGQHTISTSQF
jgi:hypothetical protein